MRVRVIGVGTPRGDDAAGLAAAAELARGPLPPGVEVRACQGPLAELLDALAGADAAVLIDALSSGGPPGRVQRVSAHELARGPGLSSHALGVAEALALAEALGRAPARTEIVAIEGGGGAAAELSDPVRRGVAEAVALVRALVADLARG